MSEESTSNKKILSDILDKSDESISYIFNVSDGANAVIDSTGRVIIANDSFFRLTTDESRAVCKKIMIQDLVSIDNLDKWDQFVKDRLNDPYNSPKTAVFEFNISDNKDLDLIISAVRIPGTHNVLISVSKTVPDLIDSGNLTKEVDTLEQYPDSSQEGVLYSTSKERVGSKSLILDELPDKMPDNVIIMHKNRMIYLSQSLRRIFKIKGLKKYGYELYEVFDSESSIQALSFFTLTRNSAPGKVTELTLIDKTQIKLSAEYTPVVYRGLDCRMYSVSIISILSSRASVSDRNTQLEFINDILVTANSAYLFTKMLNDIQTKISTELGLEIVFIYLKNVNGKTANVVSALEVPRSFLEKKMNIDTRSWPNNLIFYAGQPRFIENRPNVEIGAYDINILEDLGSLCYCAVPIFSENTVIGALYTAKTDGKTFSKYEHDTLLLLCKEIGTIIMRGMIQDRIEKESAETRQCFGIVLDDVDAVNKELQISLNKIGLHAKTDVGGIRKRMGNDLRGNQATIDNLKIIRELWDEAVYTCKQTSLDDELEKALAPYSSKILPYRKTGVFVCADDHLSQVFFNLIEYIVKRCNKFPDIKLRVDVSYDSVSIYIESIDLGLSDEDKLFMFSDFEEDELNLDSGTLGLYTAYTLAKRYGGDIRVVDRVPGDQLKGVIFSIMLRRAKETVN